MHRFFLHKFTDKLFVPMNEINAHTWANYCQSIRYERKANNVQAYI